MSNTVQNKTSYDPSKVQKRKPGRPIKKNKFVPPADFGAKLFSGLAAEISSDDNIGPRRRAYTDMDALLADDIKQNEAASIGEKRKNLK